MNKMNKRITIDIRKYMMVIILVAIWGIFTVLSDGSYFTARNFTNLFRQAVFTAVLATGIISVIILGHIDLSIGSTAALSGGIVGIFTTINGYPLAVALIVALLAGALVGAWNGFWVAYRDVPPFIATMASMMVVRASLVGITDGVTISPMPDVMKELATGYLPNWFSIVLCVGLMAVLVGSRWMDRLNKQKLGLEPKALWSDILSSVVSVLLVGAFLAMMLSYKGVPTALVLVLILVAIFTFVQNKTLFGRRIYAIGGNKAACQLAGIKIKRITLIVFVMSGVIASIAGIFLSARLNSASSLAADGAEMDAIAACVIGGTSMVGGIGSIAGAMIGALVIQSIQNGMSLLDTPSFWQDIVMGLVLLFAVWFDISRKKK